MPRAFQRGEIRKLKTGYSYRIYVDGRRKQFGPFRTESEAKRALRGHLVTIERGVDSELTAAAFFDEYLAHIKVQRSEASYSVQRWAIRKARDEFGSMKLSDVKPGDIVAWRDRRDDVTFHVLRYLKAAFGRAVAWERLDRSPMERLRLQTPKRTEKVAFDSWEDVRAVAAEMAPEHRAIPIFATATGLRPAEWRALEWRDVDLEARTVEVRRELDKSGSVKDATKTGHARMVPLTPVAVEALRSHPRRLDARLVFPSRNRRPISLHNWRRRVWKPAVDAAGIEPAPTPYAMRHAFASFALRAGLSTFDVARMMGTSVVMVDRHYGHLARDHKDHYRATLAAFERSSGAFGSGMGIEAVRARG